MNTLIKTLDYILSRASILIMTLLVLRSFYRCSCGM
jgi:hypothetical protein